MPKKKTNEPWYVMHCISCKAVVQKPQECCRRYLCKKCHMERCALAPKQQTINTLRILARNLHMALNQVLAGEELDAERKENLDENVSVYLGPNYESVVEEE